MLSGRKSPKSIRARVTTVGRPLQVEVVLDGPWLERLRTVLSQMEAGSTPYPLQRYLEELIEADIVYREAVGYRGPYVPRTEIASWLRRRHEGTARRRKVGRNS